MTALQLMKIRSFTTHPYNSRHMAFIQDSTRINVSNCMTHRKKVMRHIGNVQERWTSETCPSSPCSRCGTLHRRFISTSSKMGPKSSPSGRVWVSTSTDIFTNLALEDWLFTHRPFHDGHSLLLLWRNDPCIVIGRHQNPWAECDVTACVCDGVNVARRNSGGGAVYHDLGNVCLSFFTRREGYNRRANLQFVADAVTSAWPRVSLSINSRDDLLLEDKFKVSGTAAKLGGRTAYHHCTLLTDVNKDSMQRYLTAGLVGLESNATVSVRSTIKNIREADPTVSWEGLIDVLSRNFLRGNNDEGSVEYIDAGAELAFPGVGEAREKLRGWTWVYSRTPKFTIQRTFLDLSGPTHRNLDIALLVEKGVLSSVSLTGSVVNNSGLQAVVERYLHKQPLRRDVIDNIMTEGYNRVIDVESAKVYLFIWKCLTSLFT